MLDIMSGRGKAIKIAIFVAISVLVLFTINSHFQSSGLSLYSWTSGKDFQETGVNMKKRGRKFGKGKKGQRMGMRLRGLPGGEFEEKLRKFPDKENRFNIKDASYKVGNMAEKIKKFVQAPFGYISGQRDDRERGKRIEGEEVVNKAKAELKKKNVESETGEGIDRSGRVGEDASAKEFQRAPKGRIQDQGGFGEERGPRQDDRGNTQPNRGFKQSRMQSETQTRGRMSQNRSMIVPGNYKPKIVLLCAYMKGGSTFLGKHHVIIDRVR